MIERRRVAAVIRKDWLEVARNKQAILPLLLVPLIFVVVIPSAVILLGGSPVLVSSVTGLQGFLDQLPEGLLPAGYSEAQTLVYAVVVFFMAPFFLWIPVMVASITASSCFVGEKERRTIEGLLYTPVTDRELVLAKVLASVVPAVALTWVSFVVYTVLVNVLGRSLFSGVFFPTGTWLVLVGVLVPLVAFLATSLIVAVSSRSSSVQGAQGAAVLVVLPLVGLAVAQSSGLLLFDTAVALGVAVVLALLDLVAFLVVARRFSRERIVTRL
jgi:ABC-2 type transport system permease protein